MKSCGFSCVVINNLLVTTQENCFLFFASQATTSQEFYQINKVAYMVREASFPFILTESSFLTKILTTLISKYLLDLKTGKTAVGTWHLFSDHPTNLNILYIENNVCISSDQTQRHFFFFCSRHDCLCVSSHVMDLLHGGTICHIVVVFLYFFFSYKFQTFY